MKNITFISFCFFYFFILETSVINAQVVNESSGESFNFVEGPVWDGQEFIYFTDIPNNKIIKYSVTQKTFSTVISNSNRGNGLMFNENMNLIVCEGDAGRVTERNQNGDLISTLVSQYNNIRFNAPNDLCIDKKGGIYFTDPTWSTQYHPQNRVYYITPENGEIVMLIDDMSKPNGVLLSINGEKLYVNDTWSDTVRVYDVQEDGTLTNKQTFATLQMPNGEQTISGADGMATDTDGNLYVTTAIGVQVFDKNGAATQTIDVPEKTTNCTFGGENKDILFITAEKNLYSIQLPVTGFQHPFDLPDTNLSVSDLGNEKNKVLVYPNPVKNHFAVINAKGFDINNSTVELFDLQGKKIPALNFSMDIDSVRVKFNTSLMPGAYLLRLEDSAHKQTTKIILE